MSSIGGAGRPAELLLGKRLGARQRPNSGAVEGAKGDLTHHTTLIESKSSTGRTLALRHGWLRKVAHEARYHGLVPALAVLFVDGTGRPKKDGAWVMIPESEYRMLMEERRGVGEEGED